MKKSNQQPNVDSIRRTTRLGLTALDRANPINKIVAIPESRIIPTVGYRDYSKELRSICLHHHVGTCTLGDQCDQLHVDPEYIHRTRIPQHVTCCAAHGDAFTTEYASLLGRFKFFLRMPTTASSAHHETSSSSSSQHQLQELSVNHVALTESLLPSNADPGIPIEIDVHQICRNHLNGHCKFNKECRHIHVCRELYGRIRTRSTESMNIFLPQNTAAFHHQHQHQQHTYHHHQQHNHTIQVQPVSPLVPWTPPCITPFSYPPATSTAQPTLPNNNIQQQQQPFTMYVTQQQPHQPQAFTYVMMAPPPPQPQDTTTGTTTYSPYSSAGDLSGLLSQMNASLGSSDTSNLSQQQQQQQQQQQISQISLPAHPGGFTYPLLVPIQQQQQVQQQQQFHPPQHAPDPRRHSY